MFLVVTHPTPQSFTLTSILFFSSFDSLVLVGDLIVNIRLGIVLLLTGTVERSYRTVYPKTLHFATLITLHTFLPASEFVP